MDSLDVNKNMKTKLADLAQYRVSICVSHLSKSYDTSTVIQDMNFSVFAGESLAIIGPSGCGKSTLLYLLSGLDIPNGGTISYEIQENFSSLNDVSNRYASLETSDHKHTHTHLKACNKTSDSSHLNKCAGGENCINSKSGILHNIHSFLEVYGRKPRISYVMQDYGLFPWKNAQENLALPLMLLDIPRDIQKNAIKEMLYELGLEGISFKYPNELSGGQRQRLALGRALISSPEILLLDEPLSSVDAITREHLQGLLLQLWTKHAFTCVLVTHSVSEAICLGKNIMVMGKSKVEQSNNSQLVTMIDNPCFGDENMKNTNAYMALSQFVSQTLAKSH